MTQVSSSRTWTDGLPGSWGCPGDDMSQHGPGLACLESLGSRTRIGLEVRWSIWEIPGSRVRGWNSVGHVGGDKPIGDGVLAVTGGQVGRNATEILQRTMKKVS